MAAISPPQALQRLRNLYRDAFKVAPATDQDALDWASHPEIWATHQIAFRGWSFLAAEAVVRQCRILRKRAAVAAAAIQQEDA
jgi:hypothetical protein